MGYWCDLSMNLSEPCSIDFRSIYAIGRLSELSAASIEENLFIIKSIFCLSLFTSSSIMYEIIM